MSEFVHNVAIQRGHSGKCRDCLNAWGRDYYRRNREKIRRDKRAASKKRKERKRAEGFCTVCCRRAARHGFKTCSYCSGEDRRRREKRKQLGLCRSCNNPAKPGSGTCERHGSIERKELAAARRKERLESRRGEVYYDLKRKIPQMRLRARKKGVGFDIDHEFLLALYELQAGRCAISGRDLVVGAMAKVQPGSLSVDRIDPKLGYTKGNVRLVTWSVNVAMQDWGSEAFISLCKDVAKNVK